MEKKSPFKSNVVKLETKREKLQSKWSLDKSSDGFHFNGWNTRLKFFVRMDVFRKSWVKIKYPRIV